MYADDTQLYVSFDPCSLSENIACIERCVADVSEWMCVNKLKLNEDKTEAVLCNPKDIDLVDNVTDIKIGSDIVKLSKKVKNLGVYFDSALTMESHVNHLCKCLHLELRKIQQMSAFLDTNSVKQLVTSYMFYKLDFCNVLLSNIPNDLIDKLQKIQNHAERLITKTPIRAHITPSLIKLHWLPVRARLDFKTAVLCYKYFHGIAPPYFSKIIANYFPARSLRSRSQMKLTVKKPKFVRIGGRAFSFYAPSLWNDLPFELKSIQTITNFKAQLKTYLYKKAYNL